MARRSVVKDGNTYYENTYAAVLKSLQDTVTSLEQQKNLDQIHLFEIDWDSRKIIPPAECQDFISVIDEHKASTLTFMCDRWFDDVDLARCSIVVEYVNALGECRVAPVIVKDYTTFKDKIIFDWTVDAGLTVKQGEVQFAIRFYHIDGVTWNAVNREGQNNEYVYDDNQVLSQTSSSDVPDTYKIVYSLRTIPFKTRIVGSLPLEFDDFDQQYTDVDAETMAIILDSYNQLRTAIQEKQLMWIDIVEE